MAQSNDSDSKPIDIDECLKDVIADEYTSVVFECMIADETDVADKIITSSWIKDGQRVGTSRRVKIQTNGKWHRLEITSVSLKDQGVYLVLLKNVGIQSLSKAFLYVKPARSISTEPVYMRATARHNFGASKPLVNAKVPVGGIIELDAIFKESKIEDFIWFKSNKPLVADERMIIISDEKTASLSILNAKETDSGIYLVMFKTRYGIESSFADIIVLNLDLPLLLRSELIPNIDDPFPRMVEVYHGEEVRMIAKVYYDTNTAMAWQRGPEPLQMRQNMEVQYFNNRYVALRIFCASMTDGGEYSLYARNILTGHIDHTSCTLLVNKLPVKKLSPTRIIVPLKSAVACVGSSLMFRCQFKVEDPTFCSVCWEVGNYRIERTNHRFSVFCNGTDFYLQIRQLEPDMAGAVLCEIRRNIPGQKPLSLCISAANLTIVPPVVLEQLAEGHMAAPSNVGFFYLFTKVSVPIKQTSKEEDLSYIDEPSTSSSLDKPEFSFRMTFCKCDRDVYFLEVLGEGADETPKLTIQDVTPEEESFDAELRLILFKWTPVENKWFIIEIEQSEDEYVGAGISSTPSFQIKNPPFEKMLKIRVRAVPAMSDTEERSVVIVPPRKTDHGYPRHIRIQKMEEYANQYRETGEPIGRGAFGQVVLVEDEHRNFFAAKNIRTILQKRRDSARREFELLKQLQHPKLVRLHTAFAAKDNFILVMDYLWGGELFDRLVEEENIVEMDVIIYVRQICQGLQYIHNQHIAHLDIKPENIICQSPNSRQIKIADFGLARVIHENQVVRAIYGTKDYVAPEILNYEPLSLACDMWSFGVITYLLLSGVMPFVGKNWLDFTAHINKANFNFNDPAFKDISDLAKDFINHLIVLNPTKRLTASEALRHQWLREGPPRGANSSPMRRTRENLRCYLANYRERWQRAGNVMIAAHRLRNIVGAGRRQPEGGDPSIRIT